MWPSKLSAAPLVLQTQAPLRIAWDILVVISLVVVGAVTPLAVAFDRRAHTHALPATLLSRL